jgi:hypothetical protein
VEGPSGEERRILQSKASIHRLAISIMPD